MIRSVRVISRALLFFLILIGIISMRFLTTTQGDRINGNPMIERTFYYVALSRLRTSPGRSPSGCPYLFLTLYFRYCFCCSHCCIISFSLLGYVDGPRYPHDVSSYSPSGDVTAPLVYANYGLPEDFDALEAVGVSVEGAIVITRYGESDTDKHARVVLCLGWR